jgi:hypothetical protein
MATVYLARDVKHGREVAVKVLRPDLAASIGTQRFLNEIEIAARLVHPHIVPLYDSGEVDRFLFYVMPFVAGDSLRGVLNREHRLETAPAAAITAQVANALDYAHRMGVLHRDVKPENILLSEGHAFVADFGVAKAISSAGDATITRTGFALGTPGYMSPEQAAGVRDLDERTDVYGLACVVYEMLVGETPGLWPTEEAVRLGRFVDAPPDHRTQLDVLPGRIEQVLTKALAMRPADRFSTPGEFSEALVSVSEGTGVTYSEMDLRDIVGRAAKLQKQHPTADGLLSAGIVEEIAAEVGIPADHVREAFAELERLPGAKTVSRGGTPLRTRGRYSDSEVRYIIERAAQLEARRTAEQLLFTAGGVEQIAAQVGIPPHQVRQAVQERELPAPAPPRLFGFPTTLRVDRSAEGEVPDTEFATVVAEIQTELGTVGQVSRLGGTLLWSARAAGDVGRNLQITVKPAEGKTEISVVEEVETLGRSIGGSVVGWVGGGLVGMAVALGVGAAETSLVPFFGIAFSAGGAYFVSRSMYTQAVARRRRQLENLVDRLTHYASRPGPREVDASRRASLPVTGSRP